MKIKIIVFRLITLITLMGVSCVVVASDDNVPKVEIDLTALKTYADHSKRLLDDLTNRHQTDDSEKSPYNLSVKLLCANGTFFAPEIINLIKKLSF